MADEETPRCAYRWCENDHTDPEDADWHFEEVRINPIVTGRMNLFDGEQRTCDMTATVNEEALTNPLDAGAIVELRDGLSELVRAYNNMSLRRGLHGLPSLRRNAPWDAA